MPAKRLKHPKKQTTMQAQINLLRMQGHTITETEDGYLVDGKVEVVPSLKILRKPKAPTKFIGFNDKNFFRKLKRFTEDRHELHDLVYETIDKVEIRMTDKPYAVCLVEMKKLRSSGNFKNGKLKIVQL